MDLLKMRGEGRRHWRGLQNSLLPSFAITFLYSRNSVRRNIGELIIFFKQYPLRTSSSHLEAGGRLTS